MKTKGFLTTVLLLILGSAVVYGAGEKVRLHSTSSTNAIAQKWVEEYNRIAGANMVEVLMDNQGKQQLTHGDLFIMTGSDSFEFASSWKMLVARDVVVPVISSDNQYISDLLHHGISPSVLAALLKGENNVTWGTLPGNQMNKTAMVCLLDDDRILNTLKVFTGNEVTRTSLRMAANPAELFEELRKDPSLIGICRLADITEAEGRSIRESIVLLPIDRDGNGTIDHSEDIYSDLNSFSRGVWIGKYPHALVSNVYSVASSLPENEDARAFLKWIIYDGQKTLGSDNLTALTPLEVQSSAALLVPVPVPAGNAMAPSVFRTLLIVAILILFMGFLVDFAARRLSKQKQTKITPVMNVNKTFNESTIELPGGLYFDKTHTWAYLQQDGSVKVGIDDFLLHLTGPVTRVRMKSPGEKIKKGEEIMSIIRNGKQLNLYSPVSGTIKQKNIILDSDITKLNNSPYTEGWIYSVEPENWGRENMLLFNAARQREFIKSEISRIKDLLSGIMNSQHVQSAVVLQDGGALIDQPLSELTPEVWEEYQSKFLDPARQIWFYELF
ncbi:MAG TPA: hypothetical protein VHO68_04050 [Bacteroidales bacterium]|nr:hypothetical protein [Bacteroidales bacterium]